MITAAWKPQDTDAAPIPSQIHVAKSLQQSEANRSHPHLLHRDLESTITVSLALNSEAGNAVTVRIHVPEQHTPDGLQQP